MACRSDFVANPFHWITDTEYWRLVHVLDFSQVGDQRSR
jgi:hypothetical protein